VKSYFLLGGAMHDAAITAWSIKGYYDYVRPISAIRFMARKGQSGDPAQDSYHPAGLPLVPGYVELIKLGDPLMGQNFENLGKVKLRCWRGPNFVPNPEVDQAGVGWMLADQWMPYQRPSFVTPPFAGYISGHSTFSSSAAEVLKLLTGDEYFPGGFGEFPAAKNEYLVFEEGPSVDIKLQWARYRDASDQCSLSRIWGGIHPPIDDMPGRLAGIEIGADAYRKASGLFENTITSIESGVHNEDVAVYPNPARSGEKLVIRLAHSNGDPIHIEIFDVMGRLQHSATYTNADPDITLDAPSVTTGLYVVRVRTQNGYYTQPISFR
jgi:hypothetical protein